MEHAEFSDLLPTNPYKAFSPVSFRSADWVGADGWLELVGGLGYVEFFAYNSTDPLMSVIFTSTL